MPKIGFHVFRTTFLSLAACLLASFAARGQDTGTTSCTQEFEVATIKPHPSGDMSVRLGGAPGKYQATNASAKLLVEQAFNLPADQVSGGPSWAESQRFDVNAKVADDCWQQLSKLQNEERQKAMGLMLQTLLKDRFKLAVSHHPRDLMVYALVVAKGGAKLQPTGSLSSQKPVSGAFMMGMTQHNAPVNALATFLSTHFRRTVVDQTGLSGRYDINFMVSNPEENGAEAADSAIFQALEDQLGLKLVSRKMEVDTIVIDHLEQPSQN
jgi:uncharacterized protein (TIGR03435 family)